VRNLCLYETHCELFFLSVDGQQIKMTEDHKISSHSERLRMEGTGEPLKDGETRLYGMKEEKVTETIFLG